MRILTRYLLRAHAGPFLFAMTALTGLLFLNAVAQRLENLAGKGLGWDVISEFLVLSLPHTVALTLPMAVLVAVLYAISDQTASNEITAMKAGGVQPQRIVLPLLGWGVVMAGVMFYFNDSVLPEANHQLKNLLLDINRKSPTFTLREQVMNQIQAGPERNTYFLTASRIDNETNELFDVAIYDHTNARLSRTTYADRGTMAFNEARTDLYLTLFDGVVYEAQEEQHAAFQQVYFERQVLPIRGIGNEMERRSTGVDRSDREMTVAMLAERAEEREADLAAIHEENRIRTRSAVLAALGREPEEEWAQAAVTRRLGLAQSTGAQRGENLPPDEITSRVAMSARTNASRVTNLEQTINRYRVEIHKKYTLAVACIVFVLVGAPLAVRFPRGGLGLVIAASSGIFAVYWAGLIGGENLADNGVAPPWLVMWIPNIIFGAAGLVLLARMGRESASNRGGDWDDLVFTVRKALGRPFRRAAGGAGGGAGGGGGDAPDRAAEA